MKIEELAAPSCEVGWVNTCRWSESAMQCRQFQDGAPHKSIRIRSAVKWSRVRHHPMRGHFEGQKTGAD